MDKIFVCAFSADSFSREDLEKMSNEELYDLALMHQELDDDGSLVTLQAFQNYLNNNCVDVDNTWFFFVEH